MSNNSKTTQNQMANMCSLSYTKYYPKSTGSRRPKAAIINNESQNKVNNYLSQKKNESRSQEIKKDSNDQDYHMHTNYNINSSRQNSLKVKNKSVANTNMYERVLSDVKSLNQNAETSRNINKKN